MLSELATHHIRCCLSAIPSDLLKSTVVDESLSSMNQQFCSRENQLLQLNLFFFLSKIFSCLGSFSLLMKSLHFLCVLQKSKVLFMVLTHLLISCFSALLIILAPWGCFYVTLKLNTCRGNILTKTSKSEPPVFLEVSNFLF